MGDMADDLRHWELMEEIKREDYNAKTYFFTARPTAEKKVYWITKQNKAIEIKDMETSHIKFSIAKCKRDNWRLEAIPYLEEELIRRIK